MHLNKEIKQNCSILSLGNAPRTRECCNVFRAALGKYTERDHLFRIHHPKRDSCQTNPHIPFRFWPVNSDSTSQISPGEGCKSDKTPQSNARFRGLRHGPKDLPYSSFSPCEQHQEGPMLALFCCSFQTHGLSQDNQMRMTSGYQTSAKPLLFWSWQEGDVLQMPGSV